jgi:hypothetical protein
VATYVDTWAWSDNFLFPSSRSDARSPKRCKDTVCKAISRIRKTFRAQDGTKDFASCSIRSHSGRHRKINDLKYSGVVQETAAKYAFIDDMRTYEGYGRLNYVQAGAQIAANAQVEALISSCYGTADS